MARYGVVADIHGNREALEAALAALDARGAAPLVCLGDIVGYNADPDECVDTVRRRCAVSIAGNHELIGLKRLGFRRCTTKAAYALRRTRRVLSARSVEFLSRLPDRCELEPGIVLVHGGVRDVQQYMTTPPLIRQNAAFLRQDFPEARVCFFGHSHEQRVYEVVEGEAVQIAAQGKVELDPAKTYFINPGSVDASRKSRHKLAECAIFDSAEHTIEFLRTPYDSASAEAKAAAFGFRLPPLTERFYELVRSARRYGF